MSDKEKKEKKKEEEQKDVEAPAVKTDEKSEADKLLETMTDITKQLEGENAYKEKMEKMEAQLAALQEASEKGFPLGSGTASFDSDFDKEFLAKQGKRLQEKYRHPKHQISEDSREELAKYMNLVLRASVANDPFARRKFNDLYSKTGAVALGDSGNTSFPLPDIVDEEVLAYARETSVALQYATVLPMTSEKQSWPVESTGASFSWSNTTAESTPTASEFELDTSEVSAYAEVRNTMLQDSKSDIVGWLFELMSEDLGQEIDEQVFTGTGSPCSGILTSKAGYSVTMGTGSAAFSMVGDTDLSEMISKLNGKRKQGARFFMHGEILHYIRQLKDDNGQPIFVERVGTPVPGTIYGYPYSEVIEMTSTSASNTAFIAFGNLKHFYIGRRLGASSLQVNTQGDTPWTTNRTRFKLYGRYALGLALPNGVVRLLTSSS